MISQNYFVNSFPDSVIKPIRSLYYAFFSLYDLETHPNTFIFEADHFPMITF